MDIETTIDFSEPLDLQTIFRVPGPTGAMIERQSEISIPWDDVDAVQSYPYDDDWVKFKGPKFWVHLSRGLGVNIVLGDYHTFKSYFVAYKKHIHNLYNNGDGDT